VDRCALFVDAGYVLADGAMAVHGSRRRESVVWDYPGMLRLFANLARDRTGLPVLRCYWYEATPGGDRTSQHDALADLPGLKLRLGKIRPGRREGVETSIHRDLTTLARNTAITDAVIVCAEEDLAQVVAEVQDLGIRVLLMHIAADGGRAISAALRQECDDVMEVSAAHLRPFAGSIASAEGELDGTRETGGSGVTTASQPAIGPSQPGPPGGRPDHSAQGLGLTEADRGGQDRRIGDQRHPQDQAPALPGAAAGGNAQRPSAGGGEVRGEAPAGRADSPALNGQWLYQPPEVLGPAVPAQSHNGPPASIPPGAAPRSAPPQNSLPRNDASRLPAPPSEARPAYPGHGYPVPAQGPGARPGPAAAHAPAGPSVSISLTAAIQAAHAEGYGFGDAVAADAPALWLEAVLARKPRMPSDLEARLLQGSALPIDSLLHDEVRHALRRGFWDALERTRR